MEKVFSKEELICHDCKRKLGENDEVMPYWLEEGNFFKCKECHQKDPILRNFRKTEVYTRVVGYIRPTYQFNKGKQAEFKDRVNFDPTIEKGDNKRKR